MQYLLMIYTSERSCATRPFVSGGFSMRCCPSAPPSSGSSHSCCYAMLDGPRTPGTGAPAPDDADLAAQRSERQRRLDVRDSLEDEAE